MQVFYEKDADMALVKSRKIAIIGYGSQGRAHALNLRDSGAKSVAVALREGSGSADKAKADGFEVLPVAQAASKADLVMFLSPDETQGTTWREEVEPNIAKEAALFFAHGFNIHFRLIEPGDSRDVIMVAPKGPGHTVRGEYERGGGVPCLLAVHQDISGKAQALGLSYAAALGGGRSGIIATTFREECETDLFGEQAILCGGLVSLIHAAFETLTDAGYSPEMAYFECLHEVKLIVDLMYEGGIANMFYSVSNTAEYGAYQIGPRLIDERTRKKMKQVLGEIRSGRFAREWMLENQAGQPSFKAMRAEVNNHPVEEVGKKLREMMPWIARNRLVDRKKN